MVAGGERDHAAAARAFRDRRQLVEGAAELERAGPLQHFRLQEHAGSDALVEHRRATTAASAPRTARARARRRRYRRSRRARRECLGHPRLVSRTPTGGQGAWSFTLRRPDCGCSRREWYRIARSQRPCGCRPCCRRRPAPRLPRYVRRQSRGRPAARSLSAARQAARKILVQRADRRGADHVARPGHGKRRDRQAAGERLQQNQAEGVGLARKHEDVGGGIDLRQGLALQRPEKHGVRIFARQRRARRPVADDHLGAGQIEIEKRLEILFDRDAADAEEHRTRQAEIDGARTKQAGVDAARPQHHVAKAARAQFGRQRRRRRHHRLARRMEPAQRRPDPGFRDRQARGDVFGKAGMEARGERQPVLAAIAPHQAGRSALRSRYECCRAAPRRSAGRSSPATAAPAADPDSSASRRCGTIPA